MASSPRNAWPRQLAISKCNSKCKRIIEQMCSLYYWGLCMATAFGFVFSMSSCAPVESAVHTTFMWSVENGNETDITLSNLYKLWQHCIEMRSHPTNTRHFQFPLARHRAHSVRARPESVACTHKSFSLALNFSSSNSGSAFRVFIFVDVVVGVVGLLYFQVVIFVRNKFSAAFVCIQHVCRSS